MDQGIQVRDPNLILDSTPDGAHLPIQLLRANWSHWNGLVYQPIIPQYITTLFEYQTAQCNFHIIGPIRAG